MTGRPPADLVARPRPRPVLRQEVRVLLLSVGLQLLLGLWFGHAYDMRIFMATGHLVGTGQNPYLPQDLRAVFRNDSFEGMTSVGYPPPWPLVLGLLYRGTYAVVPSFLGYNLAIKIPIIAANIGVAYATAACLRRLKVNEEATRRAWTFLLLNPFVLYASAAWGQFEALVALCALAALGLLSQGKLKTSAVLLALAISVKPIALPLLPIPLLHLGGKPLRHMLTYYAVLILAGALFCAAPFLIFSWDAAPILRGWNAHLVVAGGMSWLTFLELTRDSYQLNGTWWLAGLLWIPALAATTVALRRGIADERDLIRKSAALLGVSFLTRAWLSEPNLLLILPFAAILVAVGDLDRLTLGALWVLPLLFGVANTSAVQLLFPSLPRLMEGALQSLETWRAARLAAKVVIVIPWLAIGWRLVALCLAKDHPSWRLRTA